MWLVRFGAVVACATPVSVLGLELAACSSFSSGDVPDASGVMETSAVDVAADAADADAADTAPPFPISPLVTVISDGARYSIEATEVTNAQFRDFKSVFGDQYGKPWASCRGKSSLGPVCIPPVVADDNPVTCIDVCDAQSYCTAIGRHLCGAIAGGPIRRGLELNTLDDEWTRACSGPDDQPYPYGATATQGLCNNAPPDGGGALVHVGESTGCMGGENGLFDMSGNAAEWENDCAPSDDAGNFVCAIRGGSYSQTYMQADCNFLVATGAGAAYFDVGFRCCANP